MIPMPIPGMEDMLPFEDEMGWIREKTDARIMWEIPTSAAMTKSLHGKVVECIQKSDMYSLNYPEAKVLFGVETKEDVIKRIKELRIPCFFRVGKEGSYMIADGEEAFAKSITVGQVVDPTGCGNCSTAAALYAWCEGNSRYQTARMANISAAYNLLQYGPYPEITETIRCRARELLSEEKTGSAIV